MSRMRKRDPLHDPLKGIRHLREDEKIARIKKNPLAFIREMGFGTELERLRRGECPLCGGIPKVDGNWNKEYIKEFGLTGICPDCFEREFKKSPLN